VSSIRLLEPTRHAERRTRVELAPDQQGRHGDVGQEVALVGLGHHEQLGPESLGPDGGGNLLEQGDELGRRVAGEHPGKRGIELLGRRCEHLKSPRDPGTHLLLGQRPLPAGEVSMRIRVATSSGWWR